MRIVLFFASLLMLTSQATAQNVTPNVIFGSGNANGSFTINQNNGVELGLRAKLRHDATGQPQNTFNWDGVNRYTFQAGVAPTQASPTAVWSFEWSINSNWNGSSGFNLANLTYQLSMTSPTGAFIPVFDPINALNPGTTGGYWDHAIGTNATGPGPGGGRLIATNITDYNNYKANNNVAQNSWKPHWYATNFNPTLLGDYNFTLTAFNGATQLASTSIIVSAVPEPTALLMVGSVIGALGVRRRRRQK